MLEALRSSTRSVLDGVTLAPASVHEAHDALAIVRDRLLAIGDPRAAFPDVYGIITRRVRDSIDGTAPRLFLEPAFISRLAGRFCELYLAALRRSLEGEREAGAAWGCAHREGDARGLLPVQHALLGLNAHINYDLALGLLANVEALGAAGDRARMARYKHDHDIVNVILEEAMPEVLEALATRHGCPAARALSRSREVRGALSAAMILTLRSWRSRVWDELLELLATRDAARRARVLVRMDRRAGLFARAFAVPAPAVRDRLPVLRGALGGSSCSSPRAPSRAAA